MPDRESDVKIAAQQVERIIGRLDSLSTLASVGAQLFTRLLQGGFSPSTLAETIESEPALAARSLSLVARRGLPIPERGFSLRRSLEELPAREIRDALLSVGVMRPFDPDGGGDLRSIPLRKGLVLHSLAVACGAEQLAVLTLPNIDPQLAYYAGLLHDMGKLALQETMPKGFARLIEEAESAGECSCAIERKNLGTDHSVVGNHLARKWRLPNAVTLAVWLHHSDVAAISRDMPEARIAAIVQLADSLARQVSIGQSGSFDPPELSERVLTCLGIEIEQAQHVGRSLSAAVEQKSRVLGLDLPNSVADYCQAAHAATAQFARQHSELSDENCRLQSASSHLDFAADFLLSLSPAAGPAEIAENFAARWQKFYQTGRVCLYLTPSAGGEALDAAVVEGLGESRIVTLEAPREARAIPAEITNKFAVLNARDRIDWLTEQLDADFDMDRTKLVPLLSASRAVGAIVFELHYPGDAQLFEEKFRISASIAGAVLDMAIARQKQQDFAERFAGLLSSPAGGSLKGEAFGDDSSSGGHPQAALEAATQAQHAARSTQHEWDLLNALAEMAAGAAHELNNPLAVISGRAQLLAEAQDDKETREILRQIYENAREASGVIEDLMTFAEPPQPRATATNVRKMLDEAVQLTGRKTNREHIDVQIKVGADVRDVFVDSAQIVSALANVIANAVESYGGQVGPIEIAADAFVVTPSGVIPEMPLRAHYERVKIVIADHGCGMDGETLRKATHPFFSAKPAGRKRGMGLAYAARFIQLNRGTLTLASELGKGTTATIYLPQKQAPQPVS